MSCFNKFIALSSSGSTSKKVEFEAYFAFREDFLGFLWSSTLNVLPQDRGAVLLILSAVVDILLYIY
jgi:hypothetical protein